MIPPPSHRNLGREALAHELPMISVRNHAPLSSMPTQGAAKKRIFDAS